MRRVYEEEDELKDLEEEAFLADEECLEILLGEIPEQVPEQVPKQAEEQTIEHGPEQAREQIVEKTREIIRKSQPEKEPEKDLIDRLMEEDMPWKQEDPEEDMPWKRTAGAKPRLRRSVPEEDEEAAEEMPRRKRRQEKEPAKAQRSEQKPPESKLKAPGSVEKDPPIVTVLEIVCGFSAVTAVITTAIAWYVQILRG